MNRTIKILQHNIEYWYEKDQDMPESEQEHVRRMICEGYSEGQLVDQNLNEINLGWWKISNIKI